jgi:transcriptional regulator of acetoin/glycerol metabolism
VLLAGPHVTRLLRSIDQGIVWQQIRESASRNRSRQVVVVQSEDDIASLTYTAIYLDDKLIGALVEVLTPAVLPQLSVVTAPVTQATPSSAVRRLPGTSSAWQGVLRRAAEQRDTSVPLLLLGEAGTGKLELAKAVFEGHHITVIDCFTVQPDDVSWVQAIGAVASDATLQTAEHASGEVVLIRHVDELTPNGAALLSAHLEDLISRRPTVRIVSTALPASEWAVDGNQRRLLDQLGVVTIDVPALRDRPADISQLVKYFNEMHAGLTPLRFSHSAMQALERAPWPGNVRQLENLVRGLLATGHAHEITPNLLPNGLGAYFTGRRLTKMEHVEMNAILEAITTTHGNKVEMARLLGISRSTLYRKIRQYRLDPERAYF